MSTDQKCLNMCSAEATCWESLGWCGLGAWVVGWLGYSDSLPLHTIKFAALGVGVSVVTMSPPLAVLYVVFLLCWAETIHSVLLFFRRNCSINKCMFGMSMEKSSSGSSYVIFLYPLSQYTPLYIALEDRK